MEATKGVVMGKIAAADAAVKVLEEWGVKHVFGIPGGSINSLMDALRDEHDSISYIQVRHEEAGAMAAAMHAKFTGHIGVCFGSAGPGGTHLLNGLYDAREDHVPVLAIIGQVATSAMNMDTFQEMNENPVYADVSLYNRTAMTAAQLPHLIDEGIRRAYAGHGVAVVTLPVDLGRTQIDAKVRYSSALAHREYPNPVLDRDDLAAAARILNAAQKPVIYAGIGTRGAGRDVQRLARKLKAPVAVTGINFDSFDHDFEGMLGSANRVACKPANEAFPNADVVLLLGNNYPFTEVTNLFENVQHIVQVDILSQHLGKRQHDDVAILGDAGDAVRALIELVDDKPETPWWRACLDNIRNWREYCSALENKGAGELQLFQVYNAINKHAAHDAIFSVDVGDVTQTSIRHLHLNPEKMWRTSALFATMGVGIPGAVAAKLDFPDREVWNLCGDGAFNMVMQEIATQVQYKLPVVNVVFANKQYGFIHDEQEDTNRGYLGVDFMDVDYAAIAVGMRAAGYTVHRMEELDYVFEHAQADRAEGKTVVIDAKITGERPIPVELLELDPKVHPADRIAAFKKRYEAENLRPFSEFLAAQGLQPQYKATELGGF
ncbi:MAG: pyruvate oxidase [Propionibacteriaceae bacterium]|jgi:pyruvate oxidase|nr:pyruvate oxidase [Propionibacteriaceae bacterium]